MSKELPDCEVFIMQTASYAAFYNEWKMLDSVSQPDSTSENVSDSLEHESAK